MLSKTLHYLLTAFAALAIVTACCQAYAADEAYPAIKGYGDIVPLPNAAMQPNKQTQYKAVFDVTSNASHNGVNGPLFHVARAVNVFASAGVPLSHLHFVAIVHGPATYIVMDNAHYKRKFGMDNPNLKLIAELNAAGVQVEVCGQALHDLKIKQSWVASDVKVTLSALSDNIIYGNQGYAYLSM